LEFGLEHFGAYFLLGHRLAGRVKFNSSLSTSTKLRLGCRTLAPPTTPKFTLHFLLLHTSYLTGSNI
jgi:hypothetical protein